MSAEARAHAERHSPFRGRSHAQFVVHLFVAGVVNDLHDNEFWMRADRLAEATEVHRATVFRALATLVEVGVLEVVEHGGGRTHTTRYRYHPEWRPGPSNPPEPPSDTTLPPEKPSQQATVSDGETVAPCDQTVAPCDGFDDDTSYRKPKEPKALPNDLRSSAEAVVRAWWESTTPRPVASFIGVVKLVERFLAAGHPPDHVRAALDAAPTPTANALTFALNRSAGNGTRPRAGPVPLDLLTRLHDEYLEAER